jgi:hypothetical protein
MASKREIGAPDVSPDVCAICLWGWSAEPPPGEARVHGFGHGMLELYADAGMAALWTRHEPWLRATAVRWGWPPRYRHNGRLLYYAEAVAAGASPESEPEGEDEPA